MTERSNPAPGNAAWRPEQISAYPRRARPPRRPRAVRRLPPDDDPPPFPAAASPRHVQKGIPFEIRKQYTAIRYV
jgi:hypothetical protein